MGRSFGWLWAAFAASTAGTWLGFGAFPLIAIRVLHSGPVAISLLEAVGLAAGAVLALPLGPWVEARGSRRVMVLADVLRFGALLSIPFCYAVGGLTYAQLVVVSMIGSAANIAFAAASGTYLKQIVAPDRLLAANARFESTAWAAIAVGPALGGAAIGLFGPVVTVAANACGFLLSALAVTAIGAPEKAPHATANGVPERAPGAAAGAVPRTPTAVPGRDGHQALGATANAVPERAPRRRSRPTGNPALSGELRALFVNTVIVNALVLATGPLLAVLLLGELGWPAWQYGLAFGLPCVGGLLGARLAARVNRRRRTLRIVGVLRVLWPVGLAFTTPGRPGLVLVIAVEFAVVTCFGLYNPLLATERLERIPADRLSRTLVVWNAVNSAAVALATAAWGLLAALTTTRVAIGAAGVLLLLTPLTARRRPAGRGCRNGGR
jgi:hypothetical protein